MDLAKNPSCADTDKRRVVGAAEGERQGQLDECGWRQRIRTNSRSSTLAGDQEDFYADGVGVDFIVGGVWRHRGRTDRRSSTSTQRIRRTSTQTVCEKIFFIGEDSWRHRGRTDSRSSAATKRVEEIFYIIREAAPRFSTSTEPGGRISCYFEFSSLQSRVVSVRGWLSRSVFAYRSPVGVDCKFGTEATDEGDAERQQLRIKEKTCIDEASPQVQLIDEKGSMGGSSSAEDPGELLHRQADEGDSGRQQLRIQEKTCIGGASRQDQLIDEKWSRSGSSSAEDPGELLHRQADEGDSGRQQLRIQEKTCIGGALRQDQLIDEKGSQGVNLHRQGIQESFNIDKRRKRGSEHQQRRIQEKICIGGETWQDHLIDEKGSKSGSSSPEDSGELLHRQTEEGRSSTSSLALTRNSRTVWNRTNWKEGRKPDKLKKGWKSNELENGRKSDELKER